MMNRQQWIILQYDPILMLDHVTKCLIEKFPPGIYLSFLSVCLGNVENNHSLEIIFSFIDLLTISMNSSYMYSTKHLCIISWIKHIINKQVAIKCEML